MNTILRAAMEKKLHPGETPLQYRERIGHVPTDPRTWGPIDTNPNTSLDGCYTHYECGCRIVGNGTSPYPFSILWCDLHRTILGSVANNELLAFLWELATRLRHVPAMYGVDGYHIDRLLELRRALIELKAPDAQPSAKQLDAEAREKPCRVCGSTEHIENSPAEDRCRELLFKVKVNTEVDIRDGWWHALEKHPRIEDELHDSLVRALADGRSCEITGRELEILRSIEGWSDADGHEALTILSTRPN